MSLYGIDVLLGKSGDFMLGEINGIACGMTGFARIYGDNRVPETAARMLEQ